MCSFIEPVALTDSSGEQIWGTSNPRIYADEDNLQLFWGDLHGQSEYHVMHSQKKDARQESWSKGISSGTPSSSSTPAAATTMPGVSSVQPISPSGAASVTSC